MIWDLHPSILYLFTIKIPQSIAKPIRETINPYGFGDRGGFKTSNSFYGIPVAWDRFVEFKRNDIDLTMKNTGKIRNLYTKISIWSETIKQT